MRAFLRRDSPQESEHDGFVNFKERIFFANVRIHQHINLLPYQQVDDGKIHIIAEDALLYAFFKEIYRLFRVLVVSARHQLISFGVLLDVLKKLLVGGMELLDTALVAFQQYFQYVFGCGKHISQKLIPFFLTFQNALLQQGFLVRKNFIKGTFGNTQ